MRLEGKIAIVVGAGQSPGEGIGNGRATTLRFVQEGAKVLDVDRLIASAEETSAMAAWDGGECVPFAADVTRETPSPPRSPRPGGAGAGSTSCTTMSGSALPAATSRCSS
jgi:NAD(P)-dependent dehydrogenase (short-subunit alcohol dehydrogenase family)